MIRFRRSWDDDDDEGSSLEDFTTGPPTVPIPPEDDE